MFACIEVFDRYDTSLFIIEVSPRSIELATELCNEHADDETIDDFLDNCEEDLEIVEALGAIARGDLNPEDNGSYIYIGEEVIIGIGNTRDQAALAYVNGRIDS